MRPIHSLPETRIEIPSETQPLASQRYSVWSRFSSLPCAEKGFSIALGVQSICVAALAAGLFFTLDPSPYSPPLDFFVSGEAISKNCLQWSLLISSLITGLVTKIVTSHFLQKEPQNENNMTTEIIDLIKKKVAQAIPERNSS